MKKVLLSSAALGLMAAPVGAETPLRIDVAMAADATARVTFESSSFVLPDEREAMANALKALPGKDRPVTLVFTGKVDGFHRAVGGVIYLAQSAGFQQITVVNQPPAA